MYYATLSVKVSVTVNVWRYAPSLKKNRWTTVERVGDSLLKWGTFVGCADLLVYHMYISLLPFVARRAEIQAKQGAGHGGLRCVGVGVVAS